MFNQWRDYDFISTILAMIGLGIAVANWEVDAQMDYNKLDPTKYPKAMDDPRNLKVSTNIIRIIILTTTILAIISLVIRHYYKILWLNKYFYDDCDTHIYYQFQEVIVGKHDIVQLKEKKMLTK